MKVPGKLVSPSRISCKESQTNSPRPSTSTEYIREAKVDRDLLLFDVGSWKFRVRTAYCQKQREPAPLGNRQTANADLKIVYRNHCSRLQIIGALPQDILEQSAEWLTSQAFEANADHRWPTGLRQGKLGMKIRIQCHNNAVLIRSLPDNFGIFRLRQADFTRVDCIKTRLTKNRRRGTWRSLVEQQFHHGVLSAITLSSRLAAA